ncbi:bifunctional aspartate kinase/homoserine dehydrogenase I [Tahibacter amnicola]|uniref:Bifunctional aspartokinase/homoserine dehydrogenase n=1 Tax=Tahibacter amnicola TaxID=2976241 RepID=A0ABY6BJ59_9GAMM|nr:bifunctional aspartate kinase/homoserine dehydrogenase I [Tahibacter amnicola]UXI69797.1 bifunctional aspartate kinase/homoserine dehydrogenase I [Tahibacter amnicola]
MKSLAVTLADPPKPGAAGVLPAQPLTIAHKFGGTSVLNAERYRHVASLLVAREEAVQATVVSAMKGVTDDLIGLAMAAAANTTSWRERLAQLRERHVVAANALLGEKAAATLEWFEARFTELGEVLHALSVLGTPPREALELVQGLGEVYSARLLADYLAAQGEDVAMLDARDVLVVRHGDLGVDVDWSESGAKFAAWREAHPARRVVITGFVARDDSGRVTILGRNGSDYSGAIFAALFHAQELHIWTDVDGVLSADPRLVPEAVPLAALSYHEACELAYFGAKVVHPQTMTPAITRGTPILIRNTFRPDHPGTRIAAVGDDAGPVKGLTLCPDLALVNLEGAGMIGVPGTAERVFAALRDARVSVVMISQGSSEHSICCVVRESEAQVARVALEHAFVRELANGQVQSVQLTRRISVLAAVGDGMAGTPGVAARLFETLGRARVNIRAIAQGASERNISVAIASDDADKALRAAHAGFWLSPQTLSVGVIGPGKVGAALLDQIHAAVGRLKQTANLDLRLRAVASRQKMWLDEFGETGNWQQRLADSPTPTDLDAFVRHLQSAHLPHTVIIDCSASNSVAERYPEWLAAGIHVITPNKQAGAGPLERYRAIRAACHSSGARFRYEATVGAGLPVVTTLRDLLDTGDELVAIEGIFSGTLAWLFNRYDGSKPFSALVREAHAMGYTEPDPRDDLSGTDVARKLVILAREAGNALSLNEVQVQSLVPEGLRSAAADAFMARLEELDAPMAARHATATRAGNVLRYVARLDKDGKASVGLVELPGDHAFAHLRLTDNIVLFSTRRYCENPLVVQGPGAGPEVTAAGVFADLLRVAAALGARV